VDERLLSRVLGLEQVSSASAARPRATASPSRAMREVIRD
jgi:hypothetical protein